ncbi:hypothetical protein [Tateyamaria omphalii]|uniref:Uncharacterized protein n=1 Tax=Tateyamaria omphalii TaxID=299262 RepID=A0A1P8MVM0_9RHOB|nr:hypothetical protein [Tateyamaria omphalii]APX11989.1 hypothetical protein BWR18_10095 [Tateyamaria omphalii]
MNAAEVIQITAIDGGLAPTEAAMVALAYPLKRGRRAGDAARAANLSPGPGPQVGLSRSGLIGDETLPLAAFPAGLPAEAIVEVAGDGVPEYHVARRFDTQTDASGAYRLPPLSRVARLTITANRADFSDPLNETIAPAYDLGGQQVDFLLRP